MNTESDLQAAAKVAAQYDKLTRHVAQGFKRRLEVAKAAQDTEAMIKEQIKLEVLKAARMMFSGSYRIALKVNPQGDWSDV
jgi:chromosome condensin MukBEF ATPase and DNA-binding subunit MukB